MWILCLSSLDQGTIEHTMDRFLPQKLRPGSYDSSVRVTFYLDFIRLSILPYKLPSLEGEAVDHLDIPETNILLRTSLCGTLV